MRHVATLAAILPLLAACASQSPDAPGANATPGAPQGTLQLAAVSTPAIDLMKRGGTFMFSLDESDPAARFKAQCQKESAGDGAKADACYAQIRDEGAHEGMRFALDGEGHVVWTSFGREDGKDVVYIQSPMSLVADGDRGVVATFVAAPRGAQVEADWKWASARIPFAFPDDSTMVMNDKTKGKLVFHRVN